MDEGIRTVSSLSTLWDEPCGACASRGLNQYRCFRVVLFLLSAIFRPDRELCSNFCEDWEAKISHATKRARFNNSQYVDLPVHRTPHFCVGKAT